MMNCCPDICRELTYPTESWLFTEVCTADIAKKATLINDQAHCKETNEKVRLANMDPNNSIIKISRLLPKRNTGYENC